MKKLGICIAVICAALALLTSALALTEAQSIMLYDCTWGMTIDQVREAMGEETRRVDSDEGRTLLVYAEQSDGLYYQLNFIFHRESYLYNISYFAVGEGYQEVYDSNVERFTAQFGAPSTEGGDGTEAGEMIAQIMGDPDETGYMGWAMDPLTLVVLSKNDATTAVYVEFRMKTPWGIGRDTLTTRPFSVDGIRFGDSAALVQAIEQPDAYAGTEDAIDVYQCLDRTFAGCDATLYFEFDDDGVSRFVYEGDGAGDFTERALAEIKAQYGEPDIGADYTFRWEIDADTTCELYLSGYGVYVEFSRQGEDPGQ